MLCVQAKDLIGAASLLLDLSYITQLDQEALELYSDMSSESMWVLYIPNDVILWQVGGDTVSNNVIIMRAVTYLMERGSKKHVENFWETTLLSPSSSIFISILLQFSSIFSLFLITSPTLQDSYNVAVEAKARIAKLGARAGRFTKLAKLLRRREKWVIRCEAEGLNEFEAHMSKQGW